MKKLFEIIARLPRGKRLQTHLSELTQGYDRDELETLYRSQGVHGTADMIEVLEKLKAGKLTLPVATATPSAGIKPRASARPAMAFPESVDYAGEIARLRKANEDQRVDLQTTRIELAALKSTLEQSGIELTTARTKLAKIESTVKEQASAQAQSILAACGGGAIVTKPKEKAAAQDGENTVLTGIDRSRAAIKAQIRGQR